MTKQPQEKNKKRLANNVASYVIAHSSCVCFSCVLVHPNDGVSI